MSVGGQHPTRSLRRVLIGALVYAGLLLLALLLLRSQGAALARAGEALQRANTPLVGLAILAEAARFSGMGLVLWALARALGVRASLRRALRVMVVAIAARHLVPLGGIPDYALRARFFQERGARAGVIAAYFLLNSACTWASLIAIFATGFGLYVAAHGSLPPPQWLFGAAALGSLLVAALAAWLWRNPSGAGRALGWLQRAARHTPARLRASLADPERVGRAIAELRDSLRAARAQRGGLVACAALALAPPLADIAALAAVFVALGQPVSLPAMLLGYGLAAYLAFFTPLPGDAGVVEAALTLTFTSLGYDLGLVVTGVLLFRLLSFWLPIPVGLALGWRFDASV